MLNSQPIQINLRVAVKRRNVQMKNGEAEATKNKKKQELWTKR